MLIGFPHRASVIGGPGTFQSRMIDALGKRGHRAVFPEDQVIPDLILVVAGTAKLGWLRRCKRRGAKIVHRLDGINWQHRLLRYPDPLWHRMLMESRNWMMVWIRNRFADRVIYQSIFTQDWWHARYGKAAVPEFQIYNGTDLTMFSPARRRSAGDGRPVLLCVEGNLTGDAVTFGILREVAARLVQDGTVKETIVCGLAPPEVASRLADIPGLRLLGSVPRAKIPEIYAQADVYLSLEVNPPCPNAVVEALASGLPVVGFDTGALRELVPEGAGVLAPYGGDPWRLQVPSFAALEAAARQVLASAAEYGRVAREVAEQRFGVEQMIDSYLKIFEHVLHG